MPDVAMMTSPPISIPSSPACGMRPRRARRAVAPAPPPAVHIHVAEFKVEVPRALPAMQNMGTQTDDSAFRQIKLEEATWQGQTKKFFKKWIWPAIVFTWSVVMFIVGRVGIGVRLN